MKTKDELATLAQKLKANLLAKYGQDFDPGVVAIQIRDRIERCVALDVDSVCHGLTAPELQGLLEAFEAGT